MHIRVIQEELQHGLSIVQRVVPARTAMEIVQNILVETKDGRVRLRATDLSTAISVFINAEVVEEGRITLPGKLVHDLVRTLPHEPVTISRLAEDDTHTGVRVQITQGQMETVLPSRLAEDYPPIAEVADNNPVIIDGAEFGSGIEKVIISTSNDDSRIALQGVKLDISEDRLTMVSADGFRLGVNETKLAESPPKTLSVIVPTQAMAELRRVLSTAPGELQLAQNESKIMFRTGDVEVVSQIISGRFPEYRGLIPDDIMTTITCEGETLRKAIRSAAVFANGMFVNRDRRVLRLIATSTDDRGQLAIECRDGMGGNHQELLNADICGPDARIAFNCLYMHDILDVIGEGRIVIGVSSSTLPGLFNLESEEDEPSFRHVIMPMFTYWGSSEDEQPPADSPETDNAPVAVG